MLSIWPSFRAAPRMRVNLFTKRSMLAGVKNAGDSDDPVPLPIDLRTVSEIVPIPKDAAKPKSE